MKFKIVFKYILICSCNSKGSCQENCFQTTIITISQRIEGREIQYTVKWTNWNGGDTEEAERRLVCTEKLMGYAARTLKSSYVTNLDFFLRNLDTALSDLVFFTNTLIPLSIVAEATVFGSSVKFVTRDNIGAKIMYLKVSIFYLPVLV